MHGIDAFIADELSDVIAVAFFDLEVNGRRCAFFAAKNLAQIYRGAKPALCLADKNKRVAFLCARKRREIVQIGDEANAANSGCWRNSHAICFIIKRDIARDDRIVKGAAGFVHAFNRAHKLTHNFRALRVAEV